MGADIYYEGPKYKEEQKLWLEYSKIMDSKKIDEAKKEEIRLRWKITYDQMDEDYFRDSYNNSSVFWQMGLSWWGDVGDMLDDNGYLPIDEAIKLREYIEKHPIVKEKMNFKEFGTEKSPPLTEAEKDEWFEYFTKKRQDFLNMLDRSIEFDSPLICSI